MKLKALTFVLTILFTGAGCKNRNFSETMDGAQQKNALRSQLDVYKRRAAALAKDTLELVQSIKLISGGFYNFEESAKKTPVITESTDLPKDIGTASQNTRYVNQLNKVLELAAGNVTCETKDQKKPDLQPLVFSFQPGKSDDDLPPETQLSLIRGIADATEAINMEVKKTLAELNKKCATLPATTTKN